MQERPTDAKPALDSVAEAEAVEAVRQARQAALTPAERLERVHALCAQLVAFRPEAVPREPA